MLKKFLLLVFLELLVISILLVIVIISPKNIRIAGTGLFPKHLQKKSTSKNLKYYYESVPNLIITNSPNLPYKFLNTHNAEGFNERYNYEERKKYDTYRIMTLGDSFTYGLYVNTKDNWTELLETLLNKKKCNGYKKFEVINLGNTGYDISYAYERFLRQGERFMPDLILWLLNEEDFIQNNELLFPLKKEIKDQLKERGNYDSLFKKQFYPEWGIAQTFILREYSQEELIKKATKKLFSIRNTFYGKVVYLVFPSINSKYINLLEENIKNNQQFYLFSDLPDVSNLKEFHFPNDAHPNSYGHKEIAKSIVSYLTNYLIRCR
jgi:lysophospholipase L1-like esterase